MIDDEIRERALEWMAADPDPETRAQTAALLNAGTEAAATELAACFGDMLAFGTAGIRGIEGPGPSRMNRAVIRRVSAGLAQYLLDTIPGAQERGVVIGHDARTGSQSFAADAAAVFRGFGFRVFCCEPQVPTPLVAFATRTMHAAVGIVVTASHNPAAYNGYKVYWENGAQITPPHDTGIAAAIGAVDPKNIPIDKEGLESTADTLSDVYLRALRSQIKRVEPDANRPLRVVYTAMHGVGAPLCEAALRAEGVEVFSVPSQREPDPTFPTVAFPNPEEAGALDHAEALANAEGIDVVLANDPDADRLAVMVRVDGTLRRLTGDDLGAVLGDALLEASAATGGSGRPFVATTIVSSELLARIARHYQADCAETLTGFKWLWNVSLEHMNRGDRFVFCYEEAIGYAVGPEVRDKDGIGAALLVARLARSERGIWQRLTDIWARHGYMATRQRSLVDSEPGGLERMEQTMLALREHSLRSVGDVPVVRSRDLLHTGTGLPPTNCLTWWLADGSRIIVRPSGTEPKLKIYFQVSESYDDGAVARADARLASLEDLFVRELAQRKKARTATV